MSTQKLFLDSPVFGNSKLSFGGVPVSSGKTTSRPPQFIDMLCPEPVKRPAFSSGNSNSVRQATIRQAPAPEKIAAPDNNIQRQPLRGRSRVLVPEKRTHHVAPQKKLPKTDGKVARPSWPQRLLVAAAVLTLIGGGYVIIDGYYTNRTVAAQAAKLENVIAQDSKDGTSAQQNTTSDDASKTGTNNAANSSAVGAVPADQPKFIDIPKLRIHTRVLPKGLDKTGAVAVPTNTNQVGWYTNSASPGKSGAAFIMGHVSSYTNRGGVFYNLKSLEAGDKVIITMGDGRTFTYTVVSKETTTKDAVDMTKALTPISLDKPGLNLMTCYGAYSGKEQTYDQRLIVYASLQ